MDFVRGLFARSSDLQEEASQLIAPVDLSTVLENSKRGLGPEPSDEQGVVFFYLGRKPVTQMVRVPGSRRDAEVQPAAGG